MNLELAGPVNQSSDKRFRIDDRLISGQACSGVTGDGEGEIDGPAEARSADAGPHRSATTATAEGSPDKASTYEFFRQLANENLMERQRALVRSRLRRQNRPHVALHRHVLAAAGGGARARRSPSTTPPSTDGTGGGDDDGDDDGGPLVELPIELIEPNPISTQIYSDSPDPQLVESIRDHGTIEPVVVTRRGNHYVLIAGHRRVEAQRMLGLATVLARVIEVAPEDEAELIIAANRSREKTASQRLREAQALEPIYARRARERQLAGATSATTDAEKGRTSDLLAAAVGLGSGKTLERLQEIARARPDLLEAVDAGRKSIGGAFAELQREQRRQAHATLAQAVVPRADVLLGDAREVLPTLAAERFAAIVSDPPYGVSQDGVTRERAGTVPLSSDFGEWDHLSEADAEALIKRCAPEFFRVLRPGGALYLFTGDRLLASWWLALKCAGFELPRPCLLAWVKPNPAPSVRKRGWRSALEPIVYARKPGRDTFNFLSDADMTNVLTFASPSGAERVHPTQKPVGLLKRLIEVATVPGDEILDPFAGSGSTGEAARLLHRHALLIERDPTFHGLATGRIHQIESDIKAQGCEL
jgi:DNA modification methylase/ParB-like chromosome segregation protein Spo0J